MRFLLSVTKHEQAMPSSSTYSWTKRLNARSPWDDLLPQRQKAVD